MLVRRLMLALTLLTLMVSVMPVRYDGWQQRPHGFGAARVNLTRHQRPQVLVGNAWDDGLEFLAIPYADVPVRFGPPQLRTALPNDEFDATNIDGFGADACIQQPYYSNQTFYGVEDCLILNLYLPTPPTERSSDDKGMPILLWIFGGDNTASEIIPYNATKLAGSHGAVVAVVSYRLGLFGFAAFEEDLASGGSTGNAGLLDILAAAAWLRREAPAFGGDPDRLVLFGESSGATDAQILTMVEAARTTVAGSIAESGGLYAIDLVEALHSTRAVAAAVGCDNTSNASMRACMRSKPAELLIEAVGEHDSRWGPTVDGVFLTKQPAELLAGGGLHPGASVLWGANTNDSANPYMLQMKLGRKEYIRELNDTIRHGGHHNHGQHPGLRRRGQRQSHFQRLRQAWSVHGRRSPYTIATDLDVIADELLRRALELYPPRDDDANGPNMGWFQSDQFLCGQRRELLAAARAATGGGQAFLYRFDWLFQSSTTCIADSNYHDPASGSNHCDEMTFVYGQPIFDNQDPPGYSYTNCSDPESVYYDKQRCVGCTFNPKEAAFSFSIGRFWRSFAAHGTPNDGHDAMWPPFTPASPLNVVLHPSEIAVERDMGRSDACAFWDAVAGSHAYVTFQLSGRIDSDA